MMSYAHACVYTCVHAHACARGWGAPSHHLHPNPPTPTPQGGTPRIIQNSIALVYNLVGGWVGGLMGGVSQITKNLKIVD